MNMQEAEKRYRDDPTFHVFVDSMVSFINKLQFSPGEIREAVTFAQYRFEQLHAARSRFYAGPEVVIPHRR